MLKKRDILASGDLYVKINKEGRLVILMANEKWISYKFPEFNLHTLSLGQKKKLCYLIHRKFKEKGFLNVAEYTKPRVKEIMIEAMIEYYKV